jgi:hypothetical protein
MFVEIPPHTDDVVMDIFGASDYFLSKFFILHECFLKEEYKSQIAGSSLQLEPHLLFF